MTGYNFWNLMLGVNTSIRYINLYISCELEGKEYHTINELLKWLDRASQIKSYLDRGRVDYYISVSKSNYAEIDLIDIASDCLGKLSMALKELNFNRDINAVADVTHDRLSQAVGLIELIKEGIKGGK